MPGKNDHLVKVKSLKRESGIETHDVWVARGTLGLKKFEVALVYRYGDNFFGPWGFSVSTAKALSGSERGIIVRVLNEMTDKIEKEETAKRLAASKKMRGKK